MGLFSSQPCFDCRHNDLPWNIRKFVHNKLDRVNLTHNVKFIEPWSKSKWSHTDIHRMTIGQIGCQVMRMKSYSQIFAALICWLAASLLPGQGGTSRPLSTLSHWIIYAAYSDLEVPWMITAFFAKDHVGPVIEDDMLSLALSLCPHWQRVQGTKKNDGDCRTLSSYISSI